MEAALLGCTTAKFMMILVSPGLRVKV
jgi:hypothetical protein